MGGQTLLPCLHQRRQQEDAVELPDRRVEREIVNAAAVENRGVVVELAERADHRQDGRSPAEPLDEDGAQRARGAARRHVDRRFGQLERIAVMGKAGHEPARKQRVGEGGQEGRAGRYRQDA